MKNIFLVLFSSMSSLSLMAITVAECPDQIKVNFKGVAAFTDQEVLYRNGIDTQPEIFRDIFVRETLALRNKLLKIDTKSYKKLELVKYRTESGVCGYKRASDPEGTMHERETRFETNDGKDRLRISILNGEESLWIWVNVVKYSKEEGIELSPSSAVIFDEFDHGAPRTQVGVAVGLTAK